MGVAVGVPHPLSVVAVVAVRAGLLYPGGCERPTSLRPSRLALAAPLGLVVRPIPPRGLTAATVETPPSTTAPDWHCCGPLAGRVAVAARTPTAGKAVALARGRSTTTGPRLPVTGCLALTVAGLPLS